MDQVDGPAKLGRTGAQMIQVQRYIEPVSYVRSLAITYGIA